MTSRVSIDPNVRVRGGQTFAGFEDVDGLISVGDLVEVYEPESGLAGEGVVTQVDESSRLVYLSVDWSSLTSASVERRGPRVATSAYWTLVALNSSVAATSRTRGLQVEQQQGLAPLAVPCRA